ncbi:MAG: ABC transporter permease, partial [Firmicutes bacterium]|nr:ABC transporter permease [Bacillota bacterium]
MEQNNNNNHISQSSFEFVGVQTKETVLKTKPQGYYSEVFKRFIKKKSSIIALALIGILLIFAILLPVFYNFDTTMSEPYFKSARPRNFLSSGNYTRTLGLNEYYNLAGIGVATQFDDSNPDKSIAITIDDSMGYKYQPIKSSKNVDVTFMGLSRSGKEVSIDSYTESGFVYMPITFAEWHNIRKFEIESGRQVIYPMVDRYSSYVNENGELRGRPSTYLQNANYWYEIKDDDSMPFWASDANGNQKENQYIDNYLKFDINAPLLEEDRAIHEDLLGKVPENGDIMLYEISSGSASIVVRVFTYNEFVYRHGVEPSFWFGTNNEGQDIFSRLAYGLRMSLLLALLVAIISLIIGIVVGSLAGFYGGKTDLYVGRVQDVLIGVPTIVILSLIFMHWIQTGAISMFVGLLIGFVLFSWVGYARLIRTQFFRYKGNEYVLASKTLGAKNRRLMFKHIFPNSLGTLITQFALAIPAVILTEVVLYFLGILQLSNGQSTLGVMINEGAAFMTTAPYIIIFPVV